MSKSKQKRQKIAQKKAAKHKAKRARQSKSFTQKKVLLEDLVADATLDAHEGKIKKAEKTLAKLNKKYPNHPRIQFGLGTVKAVSGNSQESIKYFDKAIELDPFFVEAYYNKAVAFQKRVNIRGMAESFRKVIELREYDPELADSAEEMLGNLEDMTRETEGLGLDKYLEGQEYFDTGFALMHNHEFTKAVEYFQRSVSISPNMPPTHGNMGICYSCLGKKSLALEAFDRALELDPEYELALFNRSLAEELGEGEKLEVPLKSVDYYLDYSSKSKSYVQDFLDSQ